MKLWNIFLALVGLLLIILTGSLNAQTGWTILDPGTSVNLNAVQLLDSHTIFVAGDAGIVLWSSDSGLTWQDISPDSPLVNLQDITFFDPFTGLVVGEGGNILATSDSGVNWSVISSGVSDDLLTVAFWDSIGICGGISQTILYSADRGNSWNIAQNGFFGGGFWGSCLLSPNIGYVVGENSIFQPLLGKSIDEGINWNFTPFYLNNNEGRAFSLQFTDELTGYAACGVWDGRGAIAKTTDGGVNWISTFFVSPLYEIHFPISNASLVGFAVGEAGQILKTGNAGGSWQTLNSGTAQALNDVAFFDLFTGYIVGDNGTILKTESGGEPPVLLPDPAAIPAEGLQLLGNYPNPFNASTTIEFYLPAASHVQLKIFNALGKEVAVLLSENLPAGWQQVNWNVIDFPSGLYFSLVEYQDVSRLAKLLLLK
ncbi:MAG: hypothetical protein A2Y94_06060 [Caldithrix sp. RBG_13_44_9]|nr:MAG: hypothetical protein A2Y94_06060 [Caldithrix sp. RBG_13_44_9]